jgi:3-methyladenine DNA glycosylase AlkD
MTVKEILTELQALGNEKLKAQYIRKGAPSDSLYGVKMGDIRKVAKKVKKADNSIAKEIWNTNIMEAQLTATLLLKPKELSMEELNHFVKTICFDYVADWFNAYIVNNHPEKNKLLHSWKDSDNKWALRSAWGILSNDIAGGAEGLDLGKLLDQIEKEMPKVQPEVQWTMNFALAHTGIYHPAHRQRAIDIGNKLGIYKDYPVPRGCTSPFAPIWIDEVMKKQKH